MGRVDTLLHSSDLTDFKLEVVHSNDSQHIQTLVTVRHADKFYLCAKIVRPGFWFRACVPAYRPVIAKSFSDHSKAMKYFDKHIFKYRGGRLF